MHLGPLEGPLRRLERISKALGGLLDRLEGILSALEAILAENVAWNVHGTCMDVHWVGSSRWAERGEGEHP